MKDRILIIMRGLPGSGKTTAARRIVAEMENTRRALCAILSTDDFWTFQRFHPQFLETAHSWNRARTDTAMRNGFHVVIVDNTNILLDHMDPYVDLARQHHYDVQYWTVGALDEESIERYYARGVHRVPIVTLRRMAEEFEMLPTHLEPFNTVIPG